MGIRTQLIKTVTDFIRNSFEYIHMDTIDRVCIAHGLRTAEKLEVYDTVSYMIDYTKR